MKLLLKFTKEKYVFVQKLSCTSISYGFEIYNASMGTTFVLVIDKHVQNSVIESGHLCITNASFEIGTTCANFAMNILKTTTNGNGRTLYSPAHTCK